MYYSSPSLIRPPDLQEIVGTLERWPLVNGRSTFVSAFLVAMANDIGHLRGVASVESGH